jgi:hypothetical protein
VLPWVTVKCLDSKVLALNIKRISSDWLKIYHYPLYMLETFVEQDRFKRTCYKAANWIRVGETKGTSNLKVTRKKGHKHLQCLSLLSNYQFKKQFVKIMPNGDIQGGYTKMIISLIDFSFVRSLTAHSYSIKKALRPTCDLKVMIRLLFFCWSCSGI